MEKTTEFEQVKMTALKGLHDRLVNEQKYAIILATNDSFETLVNYQGNITVYDELHKDMVRIAMGKTTKEAAIDGLRVQLIRSMIHAKLLFLNCEKSNDAVKALCEDYGDEVWPSNKIFNYDTWAKDDQNNVIVKKGTDEDVDHMGGKGFHRQERFALAVMVKDMEVATKLLELLPHSDNFLKLEFA